MKKPILYCAACIFSLLAVRNQAEGQSFYDINTVQSINIVFSQSNWDYMLDTAYAGSGNYILAQSVTINGTTFDSVGVKYKGNSTYNANQVKNPFHIELDTYKDHNYQGYTDIKLSNAAKDPSFIREVLSYSILRKYMHAPLSNYCNVKVNGSLIGLYVSSESVSKKFLDTHFYSKDSTFIKCNPIDGAGPTTTTLPNLVYQGNDSNNVNYTKAYELKSGRGWADLIRLTNTLKNDISNIESILDVDRALWMIAYNNVTVNLDSYSGKFAQNYYLYKDGTGRFSSVLWDFNEGFGGFSQSGTIALNNTTAKMQMTHLLHSGDANWPLIQKLLSVPTYKKMYLAHMHTILSENFANGSYVTTAQAIQPVISASVQADPNKFFTFAQFQSNLTTDVSGGGGGPGPGGGSYPGISNLMNGRNTYLAAQSDFTNSKPVITGVTPSETTPILNSTIFIAANVTNATTTAVQLGYRYQAGHKFVKVQMLDDGAHGDGAAGDNVYGASLPVNSLSIQYYIYAENANTGAFSPARAEHEFYSVIGVNPVVADSIVMNEVYARGTASNPDWVEIYNKTNSTIDISGYKIYDANGNAGSKPKKVFPSGSVLGPNGFLVIVVDDADPSGFGLSANGEKIWLENAGAQLVDTVTFRAHTELQSYGRIPNGGSWQVLNTITRNASNTNDTTSALSLSETRGDGISLFPNPVAERLFFRNLTGISIHSVDIYDVMGRKTLHSTHDTNPDEIQVSGLPKGFYFLRLNEKESSLNKTLRFFKE